jgi:hypothetical protein
LKPGLYLGLFHGFPEQETREEVDDWGEQGPVIGPLKYFQVTYTTHQRMEFIEPGDLSPYWDAMKRSGWELYGSGDPYVEPAWSEDCIIFDGMEYGDWTLFVIGSNDES